MKSILKIFMLLSLVWVVGCEKEDFELGTPPTEADAQFSIQQSAEGPNHLTFTNDSKAFIKKWDFGNGSSLEGDQVTAYYPFKGEYEATLTIYTSGGSISTTQAITIDETDPEICNVEILELLTGGCDQPEGKTWVIDSERFGHFGVGPATSNFPDYYQAAANEKEGGGLYDDEYTFFLNQSVFVQQTNGDIYLNGAQAGNFAGATESPVGDFTAPYTAPDNINYSITTDEKGYTNISLSNGGFIGYNTGVTSYRILSIDENEMFIQFKDASTPDLLWYHRLIRKGYAPVDASFSFSASQTVVTFTNTSLNATSYSWDFGDGSSSTEESPVHTYAADGTYEVSLTASAGSESATFTQSVSVASIPVELPLSFESFEPVFSVFGGSTYAFIDNPDPSGANTSARVLETEHGGEVWAGLFVDLDAPLDFSSETTISLKVWAPTTGTFRLKLENINDSGDFLEVDQTVDVANQWVNLSFDVSAAVGKSYARIVLFPGWDVASAGTFYVDDIMQGSPVAETTVLTQELLTGGGSKAWVLKPAAGSFGVGPAKGSDAYYPNGADISGDRPCLFNDQFIFKTGGQYEYDAQGDIFAEGYMGLADGCTGESDLDGTDAEAWESGVHSFSFTPATDTDPAYITVRGTGAFIALPKAYNGGEYASAPPDMDAEVTYEVLDYLKNGEGETLTLTIDVSSDASAFWTFVLIPN